MKKTTIDKELIEQASRATMLIEQVSKCTLPDKRKIEMRLGLDQAYGSEAQRKGKRLLDSALLRIMQDLSGPPFWHVGEPKEVTEPLTWFWKGRVSLSVAVIGQFTEREIERIKAHLDIESAAIGEILA